MAFIWTMLYFTVQYRTSQNMRYQGETMASAKTATLTFRIEPELKEAVCVASINEHRSIANMIAVMIRDYCGRVGVDIAEPGAPIAHSKTAARAKKKK